MNTLVTKQVPDFTIPAVLPDGSIIEEYNLHTYINNKYALVFFYPLDFTFVCPSELIALHNRITQFKQKNVEVIAISVDSHFAHNAWRNTAPEHGGIGAVDFVLASDLKHDVSKNFGIEHPINGVALRGAFVIDKNKIVRSQTVNDLPLGRNIDEILRIIDALQFHEQYGEVCPAGWHKGEKAMKATGEGVATYLAKHAKNL